MRPPDFIIGTRENPYLMRWWLIPKNRLFNVYLHKILRSDDDRALHDHPWWNVSIILAGYYVECLPGEVRKYRGRGSMVFRRATQAHRLELKWMRDKEQPEPVWTLFITGPKIREWGFLCPKGWRHWRDFCGVAEGEAAGHEVGRGCE